MKKRYCAITLTTMGTLLLFTGCGSKVDLASAFANTQNIKSYSYDLKVSVTDTNSNKTTTKAQTTPVLKDGKVTIDFNGKVKDTGDRVKLSSAVKVISSQNTLKEPITFYLDSAKKGFDFNIFANLSDEVKSVLGDTFKNISTVYLSSTDLAQFIKDTAGEEEYKKFINSSNKNTTNNQVSKDMIKVFSDYVSKNNHKIVKFQAIDSLSTSSNGIYTVTLTKDDLKAIASNYFNNEEYFKNFKAYMDKSAGISNKTNSSENAKTILDSFNKSIDKYDSFAVVSKFTIKDKIISETDVQITTIKADDVITVDVDSKISDINKVDNINLPDKNAKTTLNLINLLKESTPKIGGHSNTLTDKVK